MEEGNHVVYVQYDQSGGDYNEISTDWTAALLTVVYFEYWSFVCFDFIFMVKLKRQQFQTKGRDTYW